MTQKYKLTAYTLAKKIILLEVAQNSLVITLHSCNKHHQTTFKFNELPNVMSVPGLCTTLSMPGQQSGKGILVVRINFKSKKLDSVLNFNTCLSMLSNSATSWSSILLHIILHLLSY